MRINLIYYRIPPIIFCYEWMWDSVPSKDNRDNDKLRAELDVLVNQTRGCIWLGHTRPYDLKWLEVYLGILDEAKRPENIVPRLNPTES